MTATGADERRPAFSAGVGRAVVTPPVGIAHAGWGAQRHQRASGVDMDLYCTVLALSEGETEALIVDLDVGVVQTEDADLLRDRLSAATGVPYPNIRVSYTHTHAGPTTSRHQQFLTEGQELVPAYLETLWSQTVGAARAALLDRRPARVRVGTGSCDIAINRRWLTPDQRTVIGQNPGGFTDHEVFVVRIEQTDGEALAVLVGYPCHPIVLGYQNSLLSPDFPGVTREVVERLCGAPALFLQGCAGDQMPVEAITGDVAVHRRLGSRLGAAAAAVCLRLAEPSGPRQFVDVVESGAPLARWRIDPEPDQPTRLACAVRTLTLPTRVLATIEEAEADHERLLAAVRSQEHDDTRRSVGYRAKRAGILARWSRLSAGRGAIDAELHAMRIGPAVLVGFPGEPFAQIGVDVRTASPFAFTHMAGYTNGWCGYVPTPDAYSGGGYEVEVGSPYAPEAAAILRDEALALIAALDPREVSRAS